MAEPLSFDISPDELDMFLEDVNDCLHEMETGILHLEQVQDKETLNAIFRATHTLKALAGAVGHRQMAELTHSVESLFDDMREGRLAASQQLADDLLAVVDALKRLRNEIIEQQPQDVDVDALLKRLQMAAAEGTPAQPAGAVPSAARELTAAEKEQLQALRAAGHALLEIHVFVKEGVFAPAARLYQAALALMESGEIVAQQPALADLGEAQTQLWLILATQRAVPLLEEVLTAVSDIGSTSIQPFLLDTLAELPMQTAVVDQNDGQYTKSAQSNTVRISIERLDRLMNLVGELVTGRTRLLQIEEMIKLQNAQNGAGKALSEMVPLFSHVVDQLHEEVMQARMLPIATLFNKFPRLVRDAARKTDKQVTLVVEGETTELDRAVIEAVNDPLVHILRNAVDHGLESAAGREAAGKPAVGTIRLTATPIEGQIVITVADDGRGIDPQKIKQTAVKQGFVSEEDAGQMKDLEMIDLVFMPNLTTADTVTEMSGRGMGLDIVRANIESLSGSVFVNSQVGQGTTFQLTLPLTLALVQTMLVTVHQTLYAIPVLGINAALYMADAKYTNIKGKPAIDWADDVVPLLDLRELFTHPRLPIATAKEIKPRIVIVTWGKMRVGLVVDKIIGQQEIVVKSLSPLIGRVVGVSGATILGDGRVALIIDIPGLINTVLLQRRV